jgi:hypothetical protein
MATEAASHILCECVALAEFRRCLVNIFMEPRDYDDIPLRKILHFVEVQDYWQNKVHGDTQ